MPHPIHCVEPLGLAEAEGTEQQLGIRGLSAEFAVLGTAAGADTRHVGAVGAVAVEVGSVAFGADKILMTLNQGAVVEVGGGRTGQTEVVPGLVDTPIVHGLIIEVGVGVVKAPVGDADIDTTAIVCLSVADARTGLHLVGAGVATGLVHHGLCNAVGNAVKFYVLVFLKHVQALYRHIECHDIASLAADDDAGLLEGTTVEVGGHLSEEAEGGGAGGNFFPHQRFGVDAALGRLSHSGA